MAAEICRTPRRCRGRRSCFNEAAANGRGNRELAERAGAGRSLASMRPRRMAAEILNVEKARAAVEGLLQ